MSLYLDSSAIVKLVVAEVETDALLAYLAPRQGERWVTSELAITEVGRAARANGVDVAAVFGVLDTLALLPVDEGLLRMSVSLGPSTLRSLDAIHVAAALMVPELEAVVTYDRRLAAAAVGEGLAAMAP